MGDDLGHDGDVPAVRMCSVFWLGGAWRTTGVFEVERCARRVDGLGSWRHHEEGAVVLGAKKAAGVLSVSAARPVVERPRRINVYLDSEVLTELELESHRQDRTLSWLIRRAWMLEAPRLHAFVPVPEVKDAV